MAAVSTSIESTAGGV
jgi:hypothetical protein